MRRFVSWGVGLLAGFVFGVGLSVSGMIQPARVRGFLDVAGAWDPTLAFVLGPAVVVSIISNRVARSMQRPWCAERFEIPAGRPIDRRLVVGSAMFGVGWGLAGHCPGPGVVALGAGSQDAFYFCLSMLAGVMMYARFAGRATRDGQA